MTDPTSATPPRSGSAAMCKGSWALGTACGRCSRCIEAAPQAAQIIRDLRTRMEPTPDEWQLLWQHHGSAEKAEALARRYDVASAHKRRQEEIAYHIAPGDDWERAWGAKP